MKKNLVLIILIISISTQLNAMEIETPPCFFKNMPFEIMDFIASFLTFDDVESEEEFINRKKSVSSYPKCFYPQTKTSDSETVEEIEIFIEGSEEGESKHEWVTVTHITKEKIENPEEESVSPEEPNKKVFLNNRIMPFDWLQKHKGIITNDYMYLVVYSPNQNICAMLYSTQKGLKNNTLSIVNTETNQELHTICCKRVHKNNSREKYCSNLAISSSGNIFATIYLKKVHEDIGWQALLKIKNLQTHKKERPAYPTSTGDCPTIAFNKQGTLLIMHRINYDPIRGKEFLNHTIIPLTTTLDNHVLPKKTLSHYCAQKMICKNLMLQ